MRPARPGDIDAVAALKERVLRQDLEPLVGWDPERSRARVVEHFSPAHTWMIAVDGKIAGTITLRPDHDALWLEMFYLDERHQGRGIGSSILRAVLTDAPVDRPLRLQVLVGSAALRLYERHGFVVEENDGVDIWMRRDPRAAAGPVAAG
ncbi:MAG: GNAT family N-acetyltransferase [Actinobacteria bacterium]|nr:GNAT family N-acetyltransferase [Actinomycetota bacterium]